MKTEMFQSIQEFLIGKIDPFIYNRVWLIREEYYTSG
ncbi:hypothetical protein QUF86_10340 [Peribacillus sp. NJ11]|nr:hypothetical protein [Peribacillus sp. NJ11]MDM5221115.1 hypothetical protein [Peribacillus sp. NJ11]